MSRKMTGRQRAFLKAVVEEGKSLTQAAEETYNCKTHQSAKTMGSIVMKALEKKGVAEKAYEKHGLSEDLIFSALAEDIKKKKQNRKGELELGAKLLGMLTDKKETKVSGSLQFDSLLGEINDDDAEGTDSESL
jgi:GTP cyclohydrolase FolE2